MKRAWFVSNIHSGSATAAGCAQIEAWLADGDVELVGRTRFPDEALPAAADLDAAGADTAILFAGDGTINAAACRLASWEGGLLILPGGTMNLLAKQLHGDVGAEPIVRAAVAHGRRIALPYVEAGPHRGFVGVIVGPAADWVHAREAVRKGRLRRLPRALRYAWRRTFGHGARLTGADLPHAQAVFLQPHAEAMSAAAVDARDWRSIARLGWDWLTGDWVAAEAVTEVRVARLTVAGHRPVAALFDGEPQMLPPGTAITCGTTREQFLATKAE